MHRLLVWFGLLGKRLFQKCSFIVVLFMVPVMMFAMRYVAAQDSGMLTIALVVEDPEDAFACRIMAGLSGREDVLRYLTCDTVEEAIEMVKKNRADAAWIFPEDLHGRLMDYVRSNGEESVVRIVERENNTALNFTREILSNALYPDFSYEVYRDYVQNELGVTDMTPEELRETYEASLITENIFEMGYLDGREVEDTNYLLAPMRGMLAVWLVLCGFAAVLYFMQDTEKGTFVWLPVKNRVNLAYGVQGVLLTYAVIVFVLACYLAGVNVSIFRELISVILFSLCTLGFCNVLRLLIGRMEWLGACVPLLIMGMVMMNPIFIDLKVFGLVRYIFPPIYYLKSIHNTRFMYWMAAYALGMYVLCIILDKIRSFGKE